MSGYNIGDQEFMLVSLNASDGSTESKLWKVSDGYLRYGCQSRNLCITIYCKDNMLMGTLGLPTQGVIFKPACFGWKRHRRSDDQDNLDKAGMSSPCITEARPLAN